MEKQDYRTSITADVTPQEAFNSINDVSKWWSQDVKGSSQNLNDIFTITFGETWLEIKIVELIADRKIVWHVADCYKHFLKDKKEWKDTTMTWEISTDYGITQIGFTHFGLVPGVECYEICEKAWDFYIKESLFKLLAKGNGMPELIKTIQ